jgi:hypothetical protein
MPTFQARSLRRALIATCAFAVVSLSLAAPALADGGRWGRHYGGGRYWHPPFPPLPRVIVGLPLPPFVVFGGPRPRDDGYGYGYGYDRRDDRRYQDGYDDGYDDRGREHWRRDRAHRYHRDCDHDRDHDRDYY